MALPPFFHSRFRMLFALLALVAGAGLFLSGYAIGSKQTDGTVALPFTQKQKKCSPSAGFFSSERRALTGAVKEIRNDLLIVAEEGVVPEQVFQFRKEAATQVVRLVPVEGKAKSKDPFAFLFPYTTQEAVFSDVSVGDRVYVLSSDVVVPNAKKEFSLVEVKIQPR